TNTLSTPTHGKMREPLLRATSVARALPAPLPLKASYKQTGSAGITVTSSRPHRLNNNDDVYLYFGTKSGPASRPYNDVTVTGPNTFTVNVSGASFGTYGQATNTINVTNS